MDRQMIVGIILLGITGGIIGYKIPLKQNSHFTLIQTEYSQPTILRTNLTAEECALLSNHNTHCE